MSAGAEGTEKKGGSRNDATRGGILQFSSLGATAPVDVDPQPTKALALTHSPSSSLIIYWKENKNYLPPGNGNSNTAINLKLKIQRGKLSIFN